MYKDFSHKNIRLIITKEVFDRAEYYKNYVYN